MKKVLRVLSICSLTAVLAASASMTAMAAGINAAEQRILDELHTTVTLGGGIERHLPVSYINQTENYLNTVELTEAEADLIIQGIEETKAYLTSTGARKYNDLTDAQIDEFFALCQKTVAPIHLTITYNKVTRVVSIVDADGKTIFTTTIGGGNGQTPIPTPGGKTDPIVDPNPIKTTGFDFNLPGVMSVAGTGILLVSAAGVYLISTKKRKTASANA